MRRARWEPEAKELVETRGCLVDVQPRNATTVATARLPVVTFDFMVSIWNTSMCLRAYGTCLRRSGSAGLRSRVPSGFEENLRMGDAIFGL